MDDRRRTKKQPVNLCGSAGLKICSIHARFGCFFSKVGHRDLVFAVLSGFISRSVYAQLLVSVCIVQR